MIESSLDYSPRSQSGCDDAFWWRLKRGGEWHLSDRDSVLDSPTRTSSEQIVSQRLCSVDISLLSYSFWLREVFSILHQNRAVLRFLLSSLNPFIVIPPLWCLSVFFSRHPFLLLFIIFIPSNLFICSHCSYSFYLWWLRLFCFSIFCLLVLTDLRRGFLVFVWLMSVCSVTLSSWVSCFVLVCQSTLK